MPCAISSIRVHINGRFHARSYDCQCWLQHHSGHVECSRFVCRHTHKVGCEDLGRVRVPIHRCALYGPSCERCSKTANWGLTWYQTPCQWRSVFKRELHSLPCSCWINSKLQHGPSQCHSTASFLLAGFYLIWASPVRAGWSQEAG